MGPDSPASHGGYEPVWIPLINVAPVEGASSRFLEAWSREEIVAFTSPRGPRILAMDAIRSRVYDRVREAIERSRVAVVGPSTLRAVRAYLGMPREVFMPRGEYTVRGMAWLLASLKPRGVLSLRASRPSPVLAEILKTSGVDLVEITVYRNEPLTSNAPVAALLIAEGKVDYALFTSPMQARLVSPLLRSPAARVLAIGLETGRVLEEYGILYEMPRLSTLRSLVSLALENCKG